MVKNFFLYIFELIKMVVIALVIIIPVRYYLIQPFYVKGASMEPSFYDHEYLIINEIGYAIDKPKRGDIVVFKYPKDPQEYFIKRVIGLPGEKVQIKNGIVYVFNEREPKGRALDEPYLGEGVNTFSVSEEPISLGKDEYWVMGDNRNASKDSRSFGPVHKSFFIGKVMFRGWPFDRVKLFGEQSYNF